MSLKTNNDGIVVDDNGNTLECLLCGGKMELCPPPRNRHLDARTHCTNCGVRHDDVELSINQNGISISINGNAITGPSLADEFKFARSLERNSREALVKALVMCDRRLKDIVQEMKI